MSGFHRVAPAVLVLSLSLLSPGLLESAGFSGKVQVRQMEVAYRLDTNVLRMRVVLTSGQAFDQSVEEEADASRILTLAQLCAQGAVILAELQDDRIIGLYAVVGNRSR